MSSSSRTRMRTLLDDAVNLADTGHRHPNGPHVRAALVVLCTAWETYVEDVVQEVVACITAAPGVTPDRLPHGLRSEIADAVRKTNPWRLASDGWRTVAREHVELKITSLNSPSTRRVNELLRTYVGIGDALDRCSWPNMGSAKLREYLDELISIRGDIAHRGTTPGDLNARGARDWAMWLERVADQLDELICQHVSDAYKLSISESE